MAHSSSNDPAAHRDPSSDRRAVLGWFALTVAAAAAVPLGWLVAGYTLVTRDTARMVEPLRPLVVDALRNGRLPLWNPHEALGIPLLAQIQHGVLHPVSLLGALIAPSAGMDLFVVAYVILAAGGAFVLARQFGASAAGASVAGLGFGLSGYVLSMSSNLPFLAGAATAPWALAALRAVGHSRGSGRIAGAALGYAALLFAGDPQWAAVSALLGLAFAGEAGGIRGAGRAAGALAVGGMLSAVQLLPTWDYVQLTSRSTVGLSDAERAQWALAPWRLVELVAPGFFGGRPGTGGSQVFLKLGGPTTYGAPFVPSMFVGAPLLALAFLGARSSRGARLLAIAAAVFLWLALGVHLGSDQLLRHVPVWGSFRYAEKLTGPLVLCLAILAGLGVSRLPAISVRRWKWGTLAAASLAGGVLVFLVAGGDGALESWLGETAPVGRVRLAVGLAHLCLALAGLAAAAFLLGKRTLGSRAGALAVLLVALPSVAAAPFALHMGQRGVREGDPLRAARAEGDVTRVATPARRGPAFGPDSLDDADRSVFLESRMAVMPYGAPAGIDHMDRTRRSGRRATSRCSSTSFGTSVHSAGSPGDTSRSTGSWSTPVSVRRFATRRWLGWRGRRSSWPTRAWGSRCGRFRTARGRGSLARWFPPRPRPTPTGAWWRSSARGGPLSSSRGRRRYPSLRVGFSRSSGARSACGSRPSRLAMECSSSTIRGRRAGRRRLTACRHRCCRPTSSSGRSPGPRGVTFWR